MMFGAFFCSVKIALLGSHGGSLAVTITVVAVMFFINLASLVLHWMNPDFVDQISLQLLLHCCYYIYFFLFIHGEWWLAHKLNDHPKRNGRYLELGLGVSPEIRF